MTRDQLNAAPCVVRRVFWMPATNGPEIESRGGLGRRRQAAGGLALRRVERELAVVEAAEERVVVGEPVVDAHRVRVVGRLAVDR